MAELGSTPGMGVLPEVDVIAAAWTAAGIKHPVPEVCRTLLLAQMAAPTDEAGWRGAAILVGLALEAIAPEDRAEPEAKPAETVAFAQMAAAFERRGTVGAPPGTVIERIPGVDMPELVGVGRPSDWFGLDGLTRAGLRAEDAAEDPAEPEPILIEDDDAPAEGGGVPLEPEPVAEVAPEPEAAQVEPEPVAEPEAAPVEPEPGPESEPMSRVGILGEVLAEAEDSDAVQAPEDGESWTAQQDLKLATLVFSGKGMAHASREMGRSKADCIKRYNELMPRQGSAAQQALVKRLRAQVEAEARHGA